MRAMKRNACWAGALLATMILVVAGCIYKPDGEKKPAPPPTAKNVVVLYDKAATDDLALYADPQFDKYCSSHGHNLRIHPLTVVDETGKPPAYLAPYLAAAKDKKLPVVLVGVDTKQVRSLEQPKDIQAIIRFVEGVVGEQDQAAIWANGWRKLGGLQKMKPGAAARLGVPQEGTSANEPLIPREKWVNVSLLPYIYRIHDQNGYNSCCPTSGSAAMEVGQNKSGLKVQPLSALDAYARTNGGRDQGATLEDFLSIAKSSGVCTTVFCPDQGYRNPIRKDGYQQSRAKNRIIDATWCDSTDQIGSALQRRKPVHFGIGVTSAFSPDRDGVIKAKRSSGGGGHAVLAVGMQIRDKQVYYEMVNSWGTDWGGSADGTIPKGCCLLHESWVDLRYGAWALGSTVSPSDDPVMPLPASNDKPSASAQHVFALAP